MTVTNATPEMIAAAWATWHSRHGGKLGPGPAFVEAINAALALQSAADTPPPSTHMTVADYATHLFDLHGFMLLETYKGRHAVTVTFPERKEAEQFHNTLVELSQHRADTATEGN